MDATDHIADQSSATLFLGRLVDQWLQRLESARTHREPFMEVAEQCTQFYSGASNFMWDKEFRAKFMGDIEPPKFKVTINKAFELVALFGPYLFWRNPNRYLRPYKQVDISPELFGSPDDPMVQMLFQQLVAKQATEKEQTRVRCELMESWLNYTSREQPGTLATHAQLGITEALIKGRGLLWPEHYKFPGSDRNMTGLFWDSVDNFLIDPDCNDPLLESARWIARRHVSSVQEVEKRFGYEPGSLDGHGNLSSNEHKNASLNGRRINDMHRVDGKSHDLIVWYEIWSKAGAGARKMKERSGLTDPFDSVVGDYAYICVAPSLPHPLNAPPGFLATAPDEEIMEAFSWPLPSYADSRWPVAILDFYPTVPMEGVEYPACWPLAPLAPGLGYLISMNALICALVERGYDSREQIIGYLDECAAEFEKSVINNSSSKKYVKINTGVQRSISDVVSYIQQLPLNTDLIQALEYCADGFADATALSEFLYAATSTQSRSAADVRSKEERSSVRPEKMGMDVARWITNASEMEKFLAAMHVTGKDNRPLVGEAGAMLWDQLIGTADLELIVREMKATIEASELRKPNKNREAENLQSMMQFMLPLLQQYAMATSQVEPINSFIEALGEAIELDTSQWTLPQQWLPQVDPQQMELQQQMQEMELQGKAADTEGKQAQAQSKLIDMIAKQSGVEEQTEQQQHDLGLIQSQEQHEQSLQHSAQKHLLEVIEKQQKMAQMAAEFRFQKGVKDAARQAG